MKHQKKNISLWCAMGLAVILLAGVLISATGTALGRYQKNEKEEQSLEVRPLEHIRLGQLLQQENPESGPVFDPTGAGRWEVGEGYVLTFAVANGTTAEDCASEDQRVVIRLMGSLGLGTDSENLKMYLRVPSEELPEEPTDPSAPTETTGETTPPEPFKGYPATVTRISPESQLYGTYGDGWVFTFLDGDEKDEDPKELSWLLEGDTLSVLEMILTVEGIPVENTSLLRLEITGDYRNQS